jgi:hypothetical protein
MLLIGSSPLLIIKVLKNKNPVITFMRLVNLELTVYSILFVLINICKSCCGAGAGTAWTRIIWSRFGAGAGAGALTRYGSGSNDSGPTNGIKHD